jgi:hypothetical protein
VLLRWRRGARGAKAQKAPATGLRKKGYLPTKSQASYNYWAQPIPHSGYGQRLGQQTLPCVVSPAQVPLTAVASWPNNIPAYSTRAQEASPYLLALERDVGEVPAGHVSVWLSPGSVTLRGVMRPMACAESSVNQMYLCVSVFAMTAACSLGPDNRCGHPLTVEYISPAPHLTHLLSWEQADTQAHRLQVEEWSDAGRGEGGADDGVRLARANR